MGVRPLGRVVPAETAAHRLRNRPEKHRPEPRMEKHRPERHPGRHRQEPRTVREVREDRHRMAREVPGVWAAPAARRASSILQSMK